MSLAIPTKSTSAYGRNRPAEAIGYISVHRDHDIAHFGENEILSIIFGEGFLGVGMNLPLQLKDGFVG